MKREPFPDVISRRFTCWCRGPVHAGEGVAQPDGAVSSRASDLPPCAGLLYAPPVQTAVPISLAQSGSCFKRLQPRTRYR
jgi:hypothetical protein